MLTHVGLRRGLTLVELLVTMVVGGVALSLISAVCLRQQRIFGDLAQTAALSGRLREGEAILPIDLRAAGSAARDFRDARDTAVEIRATIASGIVCDTLAAAITFAPSDDRSMFASSLVAIAPGDSAWIYSVRDTVEAWTPRTVIDVASAAPGDCAARGPALADAARTAPRVALVLDSGNTVTIGMPVRVTRPRRYSLYRSSDGAWYLGGRDWNAATLRFNTTQPVSGPYLSAASGGLVLRYYDSAGVEQPSPVADTRTISLIRFELRGQTAQAERALGTSASRGKRGDSVFTWLLVRNRR